MKAPMNPIHIHTPLNLLLGSLEHLRVLPPQPNNRRRTTNRIARTAKVLYQPVQIGTNFRDFRSWSVRFRQKDVAECRDGVGPEVVVGELACCGCSAKNRNGNSLKQKTLTSLSVLSLYITKLNNNFFTLVGIRPSCLATFAIANGKV